MSDAYLRLAKLLKQRDNPVLIGPIIGTVISTPPEIEVYVNEKIQLKKHQLVIGEEKVKNYQREFSAEGEVGELKIELSQFSITSSDKDAGGDTHGIVSGTGNLTGSGTFKKTGTIKWTDELIEGDEVILVPMQNNNLYFLLDKATRY